MGSLNNLSKKVGIEPYLSNLQREDTCKDYPLFSLIMRLIYNNWQKEEKRRKKEEEENR